MRRPFYAIVLTFLGLSSLALGADGAASFLCETQDNGQPAAGSFRLLSGEQEISKGPCGVAKAIPPGSYEALIVLDGAIDVPLRRERLQATAGQTAKVRAGFETGELLVEVTRDGHRSVGMVRLFRDGKPIASVGAGSATRLSTGSYGVEIESRGTTRPQEAVTIVRGERRVLGVDFSEARGKSSQ
jgi:hypothetical protein